MKYKAILADPPWCFDNKKTGGSMVSGAMAKYPTLTINEIKTLTIDGVPVQNIGDKNSILFLWVPVALLPSGIEVMKSWEYTYKTSIFWIKTGRLGMGFTFRNQVEQCLIGRRGKIPPFRSSKPNIISSKVRSHSQKPDEFFELIDPELEKYNIRPKIELFSRQYRDGWDGWGLEYPAVRGI